MVPLLMGLLLLSLSVHVLVIPEVWQRYREMLKVRLDPTGLADHHFAFSPAEASRPLLLIFGDSRASAWALSPSQDLDVKVVGISGASSAQLLLSSEKVFCALRPDLVLLQLGINDLKAIPLFTDSFDSITHSLLANSRAIAEMALACGARTVILSTLIPPGTIPLQRRAFLSEEVNRAVVIFNQRLSSLKHQRFHLFDAAALLAQPGGLRIQPRYQLDPMHVNSLGYSRLGQALVPLLCSLLDSHRKKQ